MKFVKRITALFLAMVMVMAMGINVCAAGNATTGWEISTKSDDTHTYTVYQILTGTLSEDGKTLSDIKAGQNFKDKDGKGAAEAAKTIQAMTTSGQTLATAIAEYVDFTKDAVGTVTKDKKLTGVASGYYLINDTTTNLTAGDSYSTYIVKVVNDVEITPKKDTVTFEKKVQDINDSTETAVGNLQDSADYDIGDSVPFTLTGTLPSNYDSYTSYYYQFSDQMEKGLTFDTGSLHVYVDNKEITSGFEFAQTTSAIDSTATGFTANGATGFTVTFSNMKTVTDAKAGSTIKVTYTAKLNENAVLGSTGNVNEAKLKYSNNPNQQGEGDRTEFPWDNVIVFTYKVVVNKVDSQSTALGNAAFKLEKYDFATTSWKLVKEFQASEEQKSFTFSGLDDGKYKLTETKNPDGYNKIDPVEFEVKADHTIGWSTQTRTDILTSLTGNKTSGSIEMTFSNNVSEGSLSTNVVNQKGSELPSTGGMGTTILYVAGIAMIVVAGVVVIARKRNA